MIGTIFCNKVNDRVASSQCKSCQYSEIPPNWSITRCTYNQRMIEQRTGQQYDRTIINNRSDEDELVALQRRAARQEEQMNRAYKRGQTKVADNIALELGQTQRQIKRLKGTK